MGNRKFNRLVCFLPNMNKKEPDINEALPEEIQEKSPIIKFLILFGGILMIILMVSYIFVSYPVGEIIIGQIESDPLDENKIDLEDFTIFFTKEVQEELQETYLSEQKVEFSVCLLGDKVNENYVITSLYQPKMFAQTFNHVRFEPCSVETKIMLHSHPYKSCVASETDINTLAKTKESNPNVLMVVMCEPARFSVYG